MNFNAKLTVNNSFYRFFYLKNNLYIYLRVRKKYSMMCKSPTKYYLTILASYYVINTL